MAGAAAPPLSMKARISFDRPRMVRSDPTLCVNEFVFFGKWQFAKITQRMNRTACFTQFRRIKPVFRQHRIKQRIEAAQLMRFNLRAAERFTVATLLGGRRVHHQMIVFRNPDR